MKAINPSGKLVKKAIIRTVVNEGQKVQAPKIAVPCSANRELNLDLLKPDTVEANNNNLASILDKTITQMKLYLGDPDCGEGGPNRPTRGPCDPPEGPCKPMSKPGYPAKPRASREPFCVKCPPKRPCNLNKCPTETEGTCWRSACQEIAFILCSQSQRSCRLGGIRLRNYATLKGTRIIGDLRRLSEAPVRFQSEKGCNSSPELPKCSDEKSKPVELCQNKEIKLLSSCNSAKPPDPPVKIVYQKCPPCPNLPKMPECIPPTPTCEIKCPPLPQCPKCPPHPSIKDSPSKCTPVKPPKGSSCTFTDKSPKGLWDKISGFMKKRKMSTASDSDDWRAHKCQTVTDICSDKSKMKKPPPSCPKNRKTSCYPEVVKCPELEKAPEKRVIGPVDKKIDYSKITCPLPKFEKPDGCPPVTINSQINSADEECNSLLMGLPGPPSKPVTLCPCPPPAKLHPGVCPCAPEVNDNLKKNTPTEACPVKPRYPCPEKRVFHCQIQPPGSSQIINAQK
ncbi:uncharacterized protein LOC135160206 isoform X2 [Diachasmimorpha longicaudata]